MTSPLQRPHYPGALIKDAIEPGLPFKWFSTTDADIEFIHTGMFHSHVTEDNFGECFAEVTWTMIPLPAMEMSLVSLGILPNSEGKWSPCVTVSTENDG